MFAKAIPSLTYFWIFSWTYWSNWDVSYFVFMIVCVFVFVASAMSDDNLAPRQRIARGGSNTVGPLSPIPPITTSHPPTLPFGKFHKIVFTFWPQIRPNSVGSVFPFRGWTCPKLAESNSPSRSKQVLVECMLWRRGARCGLRPASNGRWRGHQLAKQVQSIASSCSFTWCTSPNIL